MTLKGMVEKTENRSGKRWRQLPRRLCPGTKATVLTRLTGTGRHITAYPLLRGMGCVKDSVIPETDFGLTDADVVLKGRDWERISDWTGLEPGVFVSTAVRK